MDFAIVLRTAVLMLVAYLAGSIPVGVLVARYAGGTDPRTIGSGRTGGTNALRALGPKWAAVVVTGSSAETCWETTGPAIGTACGDGSRPSA